MLESKIKKIPGRLPPISTTDKENSLEDVAKLSKSKLLELIDRQKKIAENKQFLSKLPDKGEKIKSSYQKLLNELKAREDTELSLCDLMSSLGVQKKEVEDIEWTGNCNPGSFKKDKSEPTEDNDSDDGDLIKILATHSGAGFARKEIRVEKVPESLIKESDLSKDDDSISIQSRQKDDSTYKAPSIVSNVEEYAVHLCDKFDSKITSNNSEKFYPHRTVISKSVSKSKDKSKLMNKSKWEVTAATPPPPVFDSVKLVSLQESLDIQQKQAQQLKAIQAKQASERLSRMVGLPLSGESSHNYLDYRDTKESTSDESSDEEEHECHDEEVEHEKDVAVVYNVIS